MMDASRWQVSQRHCAIQHIGCNIKAMMAISRGFVCVGFDQVNAIIRHQSAHAAVTYKQANLFQFLRHPWSAITAKSEMVLF